MKDTRVQDLDMQALGINLLVARRRRDLSQRQLARQAKVDLSTLSRLERGHKPRVEANTLYRLSQVLGVSLDALCHPDPAQPAVHHAQPRGRPPKRRPAAADQEDAA
jgi:transcriptional regulator with XRE-family HTH domain